MSKFIIPAGVVKINGMLKLPNIFPIGHLFQHVESGIYFRFAERGGRWNKEYMITTDRGFFVKDGFALRINDDRISRLIYSGPDKNKLVERFMEHIKCQVLQGCG